MRSSLCACWTPAAFRFSRIICAKSCCLVAIRRRACPRSQRVDQFVVPVDGERAMRREALDGEGPATRTRYLSHRACRRGTRTRPWRRSRRRSPSAARCAPPTIRRELPCACVRPFGIRPRAGFPTPPRLLAERRVELRAQRLELSCHFSQITSISALLAMDLSVMCGTRS